MCRLAERAAAWHAQTVQYRPTAAELLESIADLLTNEVLPVVPSDVQHKVRVAANLSSILRAESLLGPDADARERERLGKLLGADGSLEALRSSLADRLRASDDSTFYAAAWNVLVATARDELAIAKPGHDGWEGE